MTTNGRVRERLANKTDGLAQGLVAHLRQRAEDVKRDAAAGMDAAHASAAAAASAAVIEEPIVLAVEAATQVHDKPVVKRLGSTVFDEGEDASLAVDYEHSDNSDLEEGEMVTRNGTDEDWSVYDEYRPLLDKGELHELERNPGSAALISSLRTEEENERIAARAGAAAAASEPVVVTNHETGLEPDPSFAPRREIVYTIPEMQPPERWPAGNSAANLLAKARMHFTDWDTKFKSWRGEKKRDPNGVLRVHPIPILLFFDETEEEYEEKFLAHIRTDKNGEPRGVSSSAQGERSQRMQFAVDRMNAYRKDEGIAPLVGAPTMRGRKRTTPETRSPPPAPQRQPPCPGRLGGGAQQVPKNSAREHSLSISPDRGFDHSVALSAAGAQRGNASRRDYQSAAPAALAIAAPIAVAQTPVSMVVSPALAPTDLLVQMVQQNTKTIGSLEHRLAALQEAHGQSVSAWSQKHAELSQKYEELESALFAEREARAEEHRNAKLFHARYAPRVKALWHHQRSVDQAAGVSGEERLGAWDNDPQIP